MRRVFESAPICLCTCVPIQSPEPLMQVGIVIANHLQVALEQRIVRYIKASDSWIGPDIGFRDMVTEQEFGFLSSKMRFQTVKRFEQCVDIDVVRLLFRRKTGLVDAVVDFVVHPFIQGLDLLFLVGGEKRLSGLSKMRREERVESGVEHTYDLRRFVVDDCFPLAIPKSGDCEAALILRVGFVVQFGMFREAV